LYFVSFMTQKSIEDPHRNLRLAVLIQAVKDYLTDRNKNTQKSARLWFAGKIESEPTFSFKEIIEMFGITEDEVRRYLKKASKNKKQALRSMGRRLVRAHSTESE
jgi:DNA-directed RNA polymerase specialized sigma subunit